MGVDDLVAFPARGVKENEWYFTNLYQPRGIACFRGWTAGTLISGRCILVTGYPAGPVTLPVVGVGLGMNGPCKLP